VVNLRRLAEWDPAIEITPESLKERGFVKALLDGVKILGAGGGASLPSGLRLRDVIFSQSAREALTAAGGVILDDNAQ
jgi:ribosomal protein L15